MNRTFHAAWSEEDAEWVGLCDQYPSLSCLAPTLRGALSGVIVLVSEVDGDGAI